MVPCANLFAFADPPPPRLVRPSFPLTAEQSPVLKAVLRAFDRICRASEDREVEEDAGALLTDQLAAANARSAALVPAVGDAMAAQEALAEVGLELSIRIVDGKRYLVVS